MRAWERTTIALLLCTGLPLAHADLGLNHELNDPLVIALGATYLRNNGQAQLNTSTGLGTLVDLQDTLGIQQDNAGPYASLRWRFSEKWRLEASYFGVFESGDKTISQDIHFGDVVFPVNTNVTSKLNFQDVRGSVGYSVYKTNDKELGVGLGLHVFSYDLSLSAPKLGTEAGNVLAPLPVLSLYGGFALDEQWAVGARLDWFQLTYDNYHGGLTSFALDLLYTPFKHVGFGIGWLGMELNFSSTSGSFQGKFQQNLQGPVAFVTVNF